MTTVEIDAIILKLEKALGSGAVSIQFDGRRVEYRSTKEIVDALAYFRGLKAQAATTPRRRQIRLSSSKGLD
jgi:hypothetical protein